MSSSQQEGRKGQGWEVHSHFKGIAHPFGQNLVTGLSSMLGRLEIVSLVEWLCSPLKSLILSKKGRQLCGQLIVSTTPLGIPVLGSEIKK